MASSNSVSFFNDTHQIIYSTRNAYTFPSSMLLQEIQTNIIDFENQYLTQKALLKIVQGFKHCIRNYIALEQSLDKATQANKPRIQGFIKEELCSLKEIASRLDKGLEQISPQPQANIDIATFHSAALIISAQLKKINSEVYDSDATLEGDDSDGTLVASDSDSDDSLSNVFTDSSDDEFDSGIVEDIQPVVRYTASAFENA